MAAGATITNNHGALSSDLVLKIRPPSSTEVNAMKMGVRCVRWGGGAGGGVEFGVHACAVLGRAGVVGNGEWGGVLSCACVPGGVVWRCRRVKV